MYIPRSRIAWLYGGSIFNILRKTYTYFDNVCTNLHSPQQCTEYALLHIFLSIVVFCLWVYAMLSSSVMSNSLRPYGLWPASLLCLWEFSTQEYWSGLPCLSSGDLANPEIEPRTPTLQVDSLLTELLHTHTHILLMCVCKKWKC